MPELPEVETLRRSLDARIVGRRIAGARVTETRLRYALDARVLSRAVTGRLITRVDRRAKYLVIGLEGEESLIVHLGMSGRLLLAGARDPLLPHVHVVFPLDDGADELRFRDPRRFGFIEAIATGAIGLDRRFANLGPEPLSDSFDGAYLRERARSSRRPVKTFLMDAAVVVGVGNIYASEALWGARVHPRRAAGRVARSTWDRIAGAIRETLDEAIDRRGTTLEDWRDADGAPGGFQRVLAVYGRDGAPCRRCGRTIRRTVLAGRSTFHCPGCQR